jgi:CIC family chloride channel protein
MNAKLLRLIDLAHSGYARKWFILSILIGISAGFGSIIFYWALNEVARLTLGLVVGYVPPAAAGEGATVVTGIARPWMLPIITSIGGLLSGLIVFNFAPEARGHGTDAAIDAFHNKGGFIRRRVPIVKLIASAITIGTGGSAGREGPAAQIAAGTGSALADLLKLSSSDRHIALVAGIGAGIGSIFKAPLGGAIISMEILYRRDFEYEALLPSFISSVVGYSIFASWNGWAPVFGSGVVLTFNRPSELPSYAVLGLVCGVIGIVYGRSFYYIRDLFRNLDIPAWMKPAIGGFIVGTIGIFLPQILGPGYGWLQFAINSDFAVLPVTLMIAIIVFKILATGLTIGSGGSGGVFAPGLVIGGMTGAVLWNILHVFPTIVTPYSPSTFAIVGMMALFGGIAKVPLATMIMVAEMTMDYTLLIPSMLACSIAYFVTGDSFIYESQVDTRAQSPVHQHEYSVSILKMLKVKGAMESNVLTIKPQTTMGEVANILKDYKIHAVPVVDEGKLTGIVTKVDVVKMISGKQPDTPAKQIMNPELIVTFPEESLFDAMNKMVANEISHLPVVDRTAPENLVGLLALGDVIKLQCKDVAG